MTTTVDRIADLMERGIRAGADMIDALAQNPMVAGMQMRMPTPRLAACSCEIPPPCWMPRQHGPVTSYVCAGNSAMLRLRVTNCSIERSTIDVEAAGPDGAKVTVKPKQLTLDPLERGTIVLNLDTDAAAPVGTELEALVWIRGCVDHAVRWTVRVARRGGSSCLELDIDDCPDYRHHWYDHFYCARPCRHHRRQG